MQKKRNEERNAIEEKWLELTKKAMKINPQLSPCVLPYTDYNVAGENNRLYNANIVHNYN
ncbi:hypothetical protein IMG5_071790 [Ichthyophthirius multifiliis]|uniref:Uncharacterized protein n=1 Tax=Ichthyophthirius multifiliis TaxID=5932 RepID=G0QPV8_ICHMU|nr:hypothetical protein IMG5_071790 [Ichthyophthirius multifiliis]EGR32736.1 hypothetical protein IMG5_071790 [Ichthyophthirius multifiliis]|eukprot:XP_004036722.1 hypothetical protein IMG5_071790 [Ichthyophthirius multifiliis]